jgi:DivIVA domain-containing protein
VPLLFGILVSAGVIFAIFAVTVGRGGSMTQFQPDWPGQPLPQDRPVRGADLADARFSVAFRGYRMAEVDEALDRLAVEIAQRDDRIQQLTGQPFGGASTAVPTAGAAAEPAGYDPAAYQPTAYDTAVYQPVAPAAEPPGYEPLAYEPHGYPPGVLDFGGHPTQPIPPVTDPGASDLGSSDQGTEA